MQEKPRFQITPQLAIVIAVFLIALTLPVASVILFSSGVFQRAREPVRPPAESPTLRTSLETQADQFLAPAPLDAEDAPVVLTLPAAELAARAERIERLAEDAGGAAVSMPAADGRRFLVTAPTTRATLLRRALAGESVDFSSAAASEEMVLVPVELRPATP